jgi:protein-S-isoprenylcysteine O-methyltransferase Ste14
MDGTCFMEAPVLGLARKQGSPDYGHAHSPGKRRSAGSRIPLRPLDRDLQLYLDRLGVRLAAFPTIFAGTHWVKTASLPLLAAGVAIRWTSILSLGRAFSVNVAIHADQKLLSARPVCARAPPSYAGMLVIFAALGIRLQNWISLAIVVIPPLQALLYRIHVEEQALAMAFGAEYEPYRCSTKQLIPGIY